MPNAERVTFATADGVEIVGEFRPGSGEGPWALFLHMMPATKESWRPFAEALAARGFSTLAIDLRGHGESVRGTGGGSLDYKEFSDVEHQAKIKDVEAAVRWLEARGADKTRLALAGASIGANLAIVYGAAHPEVRAVVALSPGLDYRGVKTGALVSSIAKPQKLLLAASKDDATAYDAVHALAEKQPEALLKELDGAGHGTTMFERQPGFMAFVVEWLALNVT